MTATHTEPLSYPFNEEAGLDLNEAYAAARETDGLVRVKMTYGEPAWLATRYDDARLVLGDRRFSRAMEMEKDAPRRPPVMRDGGILQMDPPDHTRLRTLVAKAFTMPPRRAAPAARRRAGDRADRRHEGGRLRPPTSSTPTRCRSRSR